MAATQATQATPQHPQGLEADGSEPTVAESQQGMHALGKVPATARRGVKEKGAERGEGGRGLSSCPGGTLKPRRSS